MCCVDSQIFQWHLHFLIKIIVLTACLQKTGSFARNWPLAHAKFVLSGRQLHINCTRVAASRMQMVPAWLPVACNMNKICGNLHATGGHSDTICIQLAASRLQDKR
jgi:hypothetical protein